MAYSADQPHILTALARLTLHQLELPRVTAAHADVPGVACLHNVMQCLHSLFDLTGSAPCLPDVAGFEPHRCLVIEPVALNRQSCVL